MFIVHVFLYIVYVVFILFLSFIYLELLWIFKLFASVIFSVEPVFRNGRLLVFLLCWVRFGILFVIKKDFLIHNYFVLYKYLSNERKSGA